MCIYLVHHNGKTNDKANNLTYWQILKKPFKVSSNILRHLLKDKQNINSQHQININLVQTNENTKLGVK